MKLMVRRCPFCGDKDVEACQEGTGWQVRCAACSAAGPLIDDEGMSSPANRDVAVRAWNNYSDMADFISRGRPA